MRSAIRTVLKRCDTRIVIRPSAPIGRTIRFPALRGRRIALEQRVLGLGVQRRGRLVQHQQQRAIAHEAARQRELLPLAEADLHALGPGRAELRLEPGRQPGDHVVGTRAVHGRDDRGLVVEPGHVPDADGMPRPELEPEEILERPGQPRPPLIGGHARQFGPSTRMRPLVG